MESFQREMLGFVFGEELQKFKHIGLRRNPCVVSSGKYHGNTNKMWVVKRRGTHTLAQNTTTCDVPNKNPFALISQLPRGHPPQTAERVVSSALDSTTLPTAALVNITRSN